MDRNEFNKYLNLISKEGAKALLSESPDYVIDLRMKASISAARVGQELAMLKNDIDKCFLQLKNEKEKISNEEANKMAEEYANRQKEVTRRELQYLREALYNFCNSCASRLNSLNSEKRNANH